MLYDCCVAAAGERLSTESLGMLSLTTATGAAVCGSVAGAGDLLPLQEYRMVHRVSADSMNLMRDGMVRYLKW